jgi:hypothetical protein
MPEFKDRALRNAIHSAVGASTANDSGMADAGERHPVQGHLAFSLRGIVRNAAALDIWGQR